MINDGIRTELNRASKAYKDKVGKNVDLTDCWDRFFKERKDAMVETGWNFVVNTALTEMRARWAHDPQASVEWNDRAQEVRDALTLLEDRVGEIYMDDLTLENLN